MITATASGWFSRRPRACLRRASSAARSAAVSSAGESGGYSGFGLVRNLTGHGAGAKVFALLPEGRSVRVRFSTDDLIDEEFRCT